MCFPKAFNSNSLPLRVGLWLLAPFDAQKTWETLESTFKFNLEHTLMDSPQPSLVLQFFDLLLYLLG